MKVRITTTWFDADKIKAMLDDLDDTDIRPLANLSPDLEQFIVTSSDPYFQMTLDNIKMRFLLCIIETA